MPSPKLANYLRMYRKRVGLTQQEVAWLLGCEHDTKVSRYERFTREPSPRTIFAYEVIFQTPARVLFEGMYQKVEQRTQHRARLLLRRLVAAREPASPAKLQALRAMSGKECRPSP